MKNTILLPKWMFLLMAWAFFNVNQRTAYSEEVIHSGNVPWTIVWHGVGNVQGGAERLPRGCVVLAHALDAVRADNFLGYCACFSNVDSNAPSEKIAKLYGKWQAYSRSYDCLIAAEAIASVGADSNSLTAVSFVPFRMRSGAIKPAQLPVIVPGVVFAKKNGNDWKLLADCPDNYISEVLSNRAMPFSYSPDDFSESNVNKSVREYQDQYITSLSSNGWAKEKITSEKAMFQAMNDNANLSTWNGWVKYYQAEIANPLVEFDMHDPAPINYESPLAAFRSQMRAQFVGDAETLLKYADTNMQNWLRQTAKIDEKNRQPSYWISDSKLTHITVLLTAKTTLENKDYVLVLWRATDAQNPQKGYVCSQNTIFVRQHNIYLLTKDLESSSFARPLLSAGVQTTGFESYQKYNEMLRHSQIPTNLYLTH